MPTGGGGGGWLGGFMGGPLDGLTPPGGIGGGGGGAGPGLRLPTVFVCKFETVRTGGTGPPSLSPPLYG